MSEEKTQTQDAAEKQEQAPEVKEEKKEEKKAEKPKKDKDVKIKESELNKLKSDLVEIKDKNVRLMAEFDNMRKRNERERADLIKYANEEVVIELLGFLENFERSIEAHQQKPDDTQTLVKGIEMVMKDIKKLLESYKAQPIQIEIGSKFDLNTQEILMQEETDEFEDGAVMVVFQKGYMLGDRVVRTAKVKVAKAKVKVVEETAEVKE